MDKTYQKFLRLGFSLAWIGIEPETGREKYFCTPKGASVIGRAGIDGIHYCRIRGFGNMIFTVSPMNTASDYVHPIAEDFEALLRLVLACGDESALEQAWQWSEAQFNAYLTEVSLTTERKARLSEIREKMKLQPMDNAWRYLHCLQENFDYSKISYTNDIVETDADGNEPEWKVFFDGNFWGHRGRDHSGKEIGIGKQFEWAGRHWLIPAIYACGKGLVVDFCMRAEAAEIRSFMEQWNLGQENDSCADMESSNPLSLNFNSRLELNGRKLRAAHSCAVCYNPCLPEGMDSDVEAKWVAAHYGLDSSCGWVIYRAFFPWESKRRPEIKTLSVTMEQQPEQISGPHFKAHAPGDSFSFMHPVSGVQYVLTVQALEQQTLPERCFASERWIYPIHFMMMRYTLIPEAEEKITICDCENGDKPMERKRSENSLESIVSTDAVCVGVIGGQDGPTAVRVNTSGGKQDDFCVACSSLHFEPVQHDIEWRIAFYEKRFDDFTVVLVSRVNQ